MFTNAKIALFLGKRFNRVVLTSANCNCRCFTIILLPAIDWRVARRHRPLLGVRVIFFFFINKREEARIVVALGTVSRSPALFALVYVDLARCGNSMCAARGQRPSSSRAVATTRRTHPRPTTAEEHFRTARASGVRPNAAGRLDPETHIDFNKWAHI